LHRVIDRGTRHRADHLQIHSIRAVQRNISQYFKAHRHVVAPGCAGLMGVRAVQLWRIDKYRAKGVLGDL
jgi:hypothetical protein